MPKDFQQVANSLRADHWARSVLVLFGSLLLLASWAAWACLTHIPEWAVSDSARLEVQSSPTPVESGFNGQVVASGMRLGSVVHAGDILVAADSRAEQLALAEATAKLAPLSARIANLSSQINSEQAAAGDEQSVLSVAKQAALAQLHQAEVASQLAERERERAQQLHRDGITSEADAERVFADADAKRAAFETLRLTAARLEPDQQVRERARQSRLLQLAADKANLEGEWAAAQAERKRLAFEIERKTVRAPVSGRLAECLPLAPGTHLSEGDKLGVILPAEALQIVAFFDPAAALGKLHPGQNGTLRLIAFPWAQYGVIQARVSTVANEVRDGKVRVELSVLNRLATKVPLGHGLPGTVEIETESVSPLALLLRTAGDLGGRR